MPRSGTDDKVKGFDSSKFAHYLSQAESVGAKHRFVFRTLKFLTIAVFLCRKGSFATTKDECSTPECISSRVRERMDFHVDPCSDFYSFACGGVFARNETADEKSVHDSFSEIQDKVQGQLHALISETIRENDPNSFKLAKRMYQQCMSPKNHSLSKFGNWPLAKDDPWDLIGEIIDWLIPVESDRSWPKKIAEFRKGGFEINSILSVDLAEHPKNQSSYIILISPPTFGLEARLLLQGFNNGHVNNYFNEMMLAASMHGADSARAKLKLIRSLEFEMKLAQITESRDSEESQLANEKDANLFTLQNLQEKHPYIQWVEYINDLLPSSVSVNGNEVVWVKDLSYFTALESLLNNTPADVIKTYLIWRAIREQVKYVSPFANSLKYFLSIAEKLPWIASAMYVREHFNQSTRETISKMVGAIRSELEISLKESTWMDESTRNKSVDKLNEIKFYDGLVIDESNFLSSLLRINKFITDVTFATLREMRNRSDWSSQFMPYIANAAYLPTANGLQIPAAILQGNFFSSERRWYMNFGAIGYTIGHEFTHAFDKMEDLLVSSTHPNIRELKTKQEISNREKCLESQYWNFTEPMTGRKVNGTRTLRENISDNGGFKLSYLAYQNWEEENGVEPKLPGLNYTSQQMFWISAAQLYCSTKTKENMDEVMDDVHPPDRFRIIGSLRNSEEFAKDFKCPSGSPMNPIEKCEYW